MRTYGRITILDAHGIPVKNPDGTVKRKWVEVSTDANGFNDMVMITTLIQCLLLNLGESPFFANYGLPAKQSVEQQIAPDFYITRTQQQFAQFFESHIVAKVDDPLQPHYRVSVVTQQGFKINADIAV